MFGRVTRVPRSANTTAVSATGKAKMRETKGDQAGFTLIELIVVIVLLGILSAIALPRFMDLRADAKRAAAQGIAAGLSSASMINYAGFMANSTNPNVTRLSAPIACASLANTLLAGGTAQYSATWTFSGTANCAATLAGSTQVCSITSSIPPAASATATIVCTG